MANKAIARLFQQTQLVNRLAAALEITPQSVRNWYDKTKIPSERVIPICENTDWLFTPHELRPDIYPYPDDGIPPDLRGKVGRKRAGKRNESSHCEPALMG